MINDKQYIDIWEHIMVVLKRKSTIQVLSFLSYFAYGNTLKRTSEMLKIKPSDIKKWNARIVNEIKSLLIKRGIDIKNITNLIGEIRIHETKQFTGNSEE
tara:strand:- start:221 stop:520 length:300 start_codon:yes stop_codon:yes gene_type:complete